VLTQESYSFDPVGNMSSKSVDTGRNYLGLTRFAQE
jgi:hypothetical protein